MTKRRVVDGANFVCVGGPRGGRFHEYEAVVIDMGAAFRNLVSDGCPAELTPQFAVNARLWPAMCGHLDGAKYVVFCFDDGHRIPEARRRFYAKKRYAPSTRLARAWERLCPADNRLYKLDEYPIEDDAVGLIEPDKPLPGTWSSVYNNSKGKRRVFEVVADVIEAKVRRGGKGVNRETTYIFDRPDGTRTRYPAVGEDPPMFWYGEGDCKAIMWGLFLESLDDVGSVLLWSIDWDVVLASMLFRHEKRWGVFISRLFCGEDSKDRGTFPFDRDAVELTTAKAERSFGEAKIESAEVVQMMQMQAMIPATCRRYELVFLSIGFGGGTDYTDGLSQFGYVENALAKHIPRIRDNKHEPWFSIEHKGYARRLVFDVDAFFELLRSTPVRSASIKTRDVSAFNEEVLSMVWYILYFGGWCSQQEPAGPGMFDCSVVNVVGDAATAEDAVFGPHRHGKLRFSDTAGVDEATLPCGHMQWFGEGHGEALVLSGHS